MADHAPSRQHGGPRPGELEALGLRRQDTVDFSVNLNPYGPHADVVRAIAAAPIDFYPDSTALAARERLAASAGVPADRIVLGNGAADLLWTLARVLVAPGRAALVVEPTFSELRFAVSASHGRVAEWRARPEDDFAIDVEAVVAAARAASAVAVSLCTPNNPTGAHVPAADITRMAELLPDTTLIVDQAFLPLSDAHEEAVLDFPASVVRVRSLTKEHTIPGVRVGYLIASTAVAARVEQARPAWTTGAAAQAAAAASAGAAAFVAASRERLLDDRRRLVLRLRDVGLRAAPTIAGFCVVPVQDGAALRRRLLARHAILVRDCASFGLPGHIRLGARPAGDVERLIGALAQDESDAEGGDR